MAASSRLPLQRLAERAPGACRDVPQRGSRCPKQPRATGCRHHGFTVFSRLAIPSSVEAFHARVYGFTKHVARRRWTHLALEARTRWELDTLFDSVTQGVVSARDPLFIRARGLACIDHDTVTAGIHSADSLLPPSAAQLYARQQTTYHRFCRTGAATQLTILQGLRASCNSKRLNPG